MNTQRSQYADPQMCRGITLGKGFGLLPGIICDMRASPEANATNESRQNLQFRGSCSHLCEELDTVLQRHECCLFQNEEVMSVGWLQHIYVLTLG